MAVMIEKLQLSGVSVKSAEQQMLFSRVDLTIPANKVVWICGEHGAGKSIVLKLLAGLIRPTTGAFLINDVNVSELSFSDFLKYRLAIGYSFEHGGLISNKTIYDNLILPLDYHEIGTPDERRSQVNQLVDRFNLASVLYCYPAELSASFRRLSVVVRSLILNPQILLLDNPTTGLKEEDRATLIELITERMSTGVLKYVLVVSHDMDFINPLADCKIDASGLTLSDSDFDSPLSSSDLES